MRSFRRASQGSLLALVASCHVGDVESAARTVVEHAHAQRGGYACLCNVHVLTMALHEATLRCALEGAWKRFPDGAPVAWLQQRLGQRDAQRIGGPDLMPRVLDLGRERGLRHFFLGSTPRHLSKLQQAVTVRFDGVEIAGLHAPPFGGAVLEDGTAIEAVRAGNPDIVWCALGAPKQELWMHRFAPVVPHILFLGVGAAFDFLAATKPRAPLWMQDKGLEWLHRLVSEPRRLGGRYARTNTEFVTRSALELLRWRWGKHAC